MLLAPRLLQTTAGFELAVSPRIDDPYFYAVMERGTWYEPEAAFIRRFARPGLRVLDIDHGIGFYSLLLAKFCGSEGRIFTVLPEPRPFSGELVEASIHRNGFDRITIVNVDSDGEMFPAYRYDHLDSFRAVEFEKLDLVRLGSPTSAKITTNSTRFLQNQSPLLMLKINNAAEAGELLLFLQSLGYHMLRYVPGLDALKPASFAEINDNISHIFFCKPDRLNDLILRELAFVPADSPDRPKPPPHIFLNDFKKLAGTPGCTTLQTLADRSSSGEQEAYLSACSAYLMALTFPLSLAERFACLQDAQHYFQAFVAAPAAVPQRLGLVLAELALGRQEQAIKILESMDFSSAALLEDSLDLPFLVERTVAQGIQADTIGTWMQIYMMEVYETYRRPTPRLDHLSSRMTLLIATELRRFSTTPTLVQEKRRILAAAFLGLPHAPLAASFLQEEWPNVDVWRDLAADNGRIQYYHSMFERDVADSLKVRSSSLKYSIALCASKGIRFKTYIDVGAADGMLGMHYYSSGLMRETRIINIEPNDIYKESLTKISRATGALHLSTAISDYNGEAEFQESGHEYWASLRPPGDPYWDDYQHLEIKTRTVPVQTIAAVVEEHELEGPIFLKMDVQGSEDAVIRGIGPAIDKIAFVVVETIAVDLTKINNALDELGFTLFDLTSLQYNPHGMLSWFYPYYIHKRYFHLFQNESTGMVEDYLIEQQRKRRREGAAALEEQLAMLAQEKTISGV